MEQALFQLPKFSVQDTIIRDVCKSPPQCSGPTRYRNIDGACNNLEHPDWGQAGAPFFRLLPPKYDDGKLQGVMFKKKKINYNYYIYN